MLGVDTNVLVRFFTGDDPGQFQTAKDLIEGASDGELFINSLVLAELHWVLRRGYLIEAKSILELFDRLFEFREFTIGDQELVQQALLEARATGGDFADSLIAQINQANGCSVTLTFDKAAASAVPGMMELTA